MAIGEYIGLDNNLIADGSFYGESAAIDLGLHPLYHHPLSTINYRHGALVAPNFVVYHNCLFKYNANYSRVINDGCTRDAYAGEQDVLGIGICEIWVICGLFRSGNGKLPKTGNMGHKL